MIQPFVLKGKMPVELMKVMITNSGAETLTVTSLTIKNEIFCKRVVYKAALLLYYDYGKRFLRTFSIITTETNFQICDDLEWRDRWYQSRMSQSGQA